MPTEYFEARERALLGQRYETLYAAPSDSAARGVTVSALRTTPGTFAAKADMALEPSPFCKAAFVVREETFKPGRHPYHHAGVFYSQEPSAASAAPLLGVKPGMRVLDLCAAPGGKSSQLAAALQGQGLLVSNEYVAARADILKSNLERMGVPNAVILNEAPARIAEALPEFFDRVLVDAPCSGEGMFRKEAVAVTQHSEALVKQCAELGARILDCAAAVLAFRSLNSALYGIISLYLSTVVIDKVLYGMDSAKVAYIITEKSSPVLDGLVHQLERGVTVLHGQGAWSGEEKQVLMCAFKQRQIVAIKQTVKELDPEAFLIVCDAHEVLGHGFRLYHPNEI